jgi:hypothetical protein
LYELKGIHCDGGSFPELLDNEILIVNFGVAGEVIKTTPLFPIIKNMFASAHMA